MCQGFSVRLFLLCDHFPQLPEEDPLVVLTAVTTGWLRWTRFKRDCARSQLGNNAENQSAALVTALFNW